MNNKTTRRINNFVTSNALPQLEVAIWNNGNSYHNSLGVDAQPETDVFEIGSIGKTLTATLLAKLCRLGIVSLDDPVSKFRPDLPVATQITLLHLATHTSGLPSNPVKLSWIFQAKNSERVKQFKKSDFDKTLTELKKPLKSGKFNYSNLGMALLGNILADCLSCRYEDAVKEHILLPLNMLDTHISDNAYEAKRVALGHDYRGDPVEPFVWEYMEPAGLWRSTAKDMMIFLKAHLGGSGEDWEDLLAKTTQPVCDNPKLSHLGLAWIIEDSKKLGRYVWHNGGTFGQRSVAIVSKEKKMAAILLTNQLPRFWKMFLPRYSLEKLAEDILIMNLKGS